MTIRELIVDLQKIVLENPELADVPIVMANDEEGNGFVPMTNDYMGVGYVDDLETCEVVDSEDLDEVEKEDMIYVVTFWPG